MIQKLKRRIFNNAALDEEIKKLKFHLKVLEYWLGNIKECGENKIPDILGITPREEVTEEVNYLYLRTFGGSASSSLLSKRKDVHKQIERTENRILQLEAIKSQDSIKRSQYIIAFAMIATVLIGLYTVDMTKKNYDKQLELMHQQFQYMQPNSATLDLINANIGDFSKQDLMKKASNYAGIRLTFRNRGRMDVRYGYMRLISDGVKPVLDAYIKDLKSGEWTGVTIPVMSTACDWRNNPENRSEEIWHCYESQIEAGKKTLILEIQCNECEPQIWNETFDTCIWENSSLECDK
ncbi:MAG: hypothetical protein KKA79_03880 [Nanoarchaeota archaeon]|nr:hypothetical protein [Nanoarchaeota archaeon]